MPHRLAIVLCSLLLAGCSPRSDAQPVPAPAAATPVRDDDPAREARLRSALQAADAGRLDRAVHAVALRDPLAPWIEFAALRRALDTLDTAAGAAFLQRHGGQPVAEAFRIEWLRALARRQQWAAFNAAWRDDVEDPALRCAHVQANATTSTWSNRALPLWRSGKPLPDACAPVIALLGDAGLLTAAERWTRIDAAIPDRAVAVIRAVSAGFDADEARRANAYADFLQAPADAPTADWPQDRRSAAVITAGLIGWAKRDVGAAEAAYGALAERFALDLDQRGRVLYEIALQSGVSYQPDAARRLAAVPVSHYDDRLFELRAREAIAQRDWRGALAAIAAMPPTLRDGARWQLLAGRVHAELGDRRSADVAYARAAGSSDVHGFLAADALDRPYVLCPDPWQSTPAGQREAAGNAGLERAVMLHRLGRPAWAAREWKAATATLRRDQRNEAIAWAIARGWTDRAVFGLDLQANPADVRLFGLRFPLAYAETIAREAARNRIDPAWVAAEIRAESVFNPQARSQANAIGLMQLLPATAAELARTQGIAYRDADSLLDPDTNIALGSAYLRRMLDRHGGSVPAAIAAYNAGPTPTARWLAQRAGMDPALWIETISYKETRDYVARVLGFSALYDWRLQGHALRLTDRIAGNPNGARAEFVCPAPPP